MSVDELVEIKVAAICSVVMVTDEVIVGPVAMRPHQDTFMFHSSKEEVLTNHSQDADDQHRHDDDTSQSLHQLDESSGRRLHTWMCS